MRAIPETITEFDHVYDTGVPVSMEEFINVVRMFKGDPDYIVNEYTLPDGGGKVYAQFFAPEGSKHAYMSSYSWHVPPSFFDNGDPFDF